MKISKISVGLSVVAVLAWTVFQWRTVSSLEGRSKELRERIAEAEGTGDGRPGNRSRRLRPAVDRGLPDWETLSAGLVEMNQGGSAGDLREIMRLQKRVAGMDDQEILAAFDDISGMDMDAEAKSLLEDLLLDPLIKNNPALALQTFSDRIGDPDDPVGWRMSSAFGAWAKRDPSAAGAWFDRQIAEGGFESRSLDGLSQERLDFEAELVEVLLSMDVNAAGERLSALPDDQRREALEGIVFSTLDAPARTGYAELVRSLVPEDERAGSFTHVTSELMSGGGFATVEAFLDGIKASPAERQVSAREAANSQILQIASERTLSRGDLDVMRAWLEQQAPGSADRVTGEALGDASQESADFGFEEGSALALEYHELTGNDDVLEAFIESYAERSNLEAALPLIEKVSDAGRREALMARLK